MLEIILKELQLFLFSLAYFLSIDYNLLKIDNSAPGEHESKS